MDKLVLRVDSNLTAIGLYIDYLEESLASFVIARRYMALMEERCVDSEL